MSSRNQLDDLIRDVAQLKERMGNFCRWGTIDKVNGDKLRLKLDEKGGDGKPVYGPYLNNGNMRGGSRERRYYKEGQTACMICPDGDPSHGIIFPYAPNDSFKAPSHAGANDDTVQIDAFRSRENATGATRWIQPEQQQSGGTQQGGQQQQSEVAVAARMHATAGNTGRVGTKTRFASHTKGAKIKHDKAFVVTSDDGVIIKGDKIYLSRVPEIKSKDDPIPDDNDVS